MVQTAFFRQPGPLLTPQSSEAMATADQGRLRFPQTPPLQNEYSADSADSTP